MAAVAEVLPPVEIRPQPGPQEAFLASPADIVIYGGAAGGGKSWALLLEPLRHIHVPRFAAVIFRRTTPQIRNPGGLWDKSLELYSQLGATPRSQELDHRFGAGPSAPVIKLAHMEHEKDRLDWQGSEVAYFGFDELTHFTALQFWYVALSRGRSMCGVTPYVRATTNPDADSWVADLISWWIDQETGFPIPERSGVVRWFWRIEDRLFWYDSAAEAREAHPEQCQMSDNAGNVIRIEPKSLTFIASKVTDNPALLRVNPEYLGGLMALPLVERERLLHGNWKIRPEAGKVFNRAWFKIVDAAPAEGPTVRRWDKAGTEGGGDHTSGVAMRKCGPKYYILDYIAAQHELWRRESLLRQTAELDGHGVEISIEQEPGSGGKDSAAITVQNLAGWNVHVDKVTGSKLSRWAPLAAQAEAGNVYLVRSAWNKDFLDVLHGADGSGGKRDDAADAAAGAFNHLTLNAPPAPPTATVINVR